MKLDITLCCSVIKTCLESEIRNVSRFDRDIESTDEGLKILDEIKIRRIVFCLELEEKNEAYFDRNAPDLKGVYQDFITFLIQNEEYVLFLNNYIEDSRIEQIASDDYQKTLLNTAYQTIDKIIFSYMLDCHKTNVNNLEIKILNKSEILDKDSNTILNEYRMSRPREFSASDMVTCNYVSNWLSRFWKTETQFIIIDNYVYIHRMKLRKYILEYMPRGSKIIIYTFRNGKTDQEVIRGFQTPNFSYWNFEIYLYDDKKEQHDRCIITDNYHIQINNLIGAFDNNGTGVISQTTITPNYKFNVEGHSKRPRASKIF